MNDSDATPELISEDDARDQVETYLKNRYHEFDKVKFASCTLRGTGTDAIYTFRGTIILKSRGTLERFVAEKSAGKYQFEFEISAADGHVINYVFT